MLKNKKAQESGIGMSLGAIGRIILALAALVLVFVACDRLREVFYSTDSKSFEAFVGGINEMSSDGTEEFVLELNEGSAIVGFRKGATAFECYSCGEGIKMERVNEKTSKPDNSECSGTACICLCDKGFEAEPDPAKKGTSENVWIGKCKSDWICKKLDNDIDISPNTFIRKMSHFIFGSDTYQHWINGFLFARKVLNANGLTNVEEMNFLYVEKKGNLIGVCNEYILHFNEDTLKFSTDTCINKDYTP